MGVSEKVLQTIRRERMLSPGCTVVAGVSGGADSIALLHVLCALRRDGYIALVRAVHVNHGLRGEESLRDQRFTEDVCRRWNVPLDVVMYDVAAIAEEQGTGLEETGRRLRYQTFEAVAQRYDNARIATAHTADDNAETLLLHLCRGSGLHGVTGIPAVRGNIIRPLLDCTREEIETYCAQHNLAYVTDSSNADVSYTRNRIRLSVMPQLRHINPQVTAAFTRFMSQAAQIERYLEQPVSRAVEQAKTEEHDVFRRDVLFALEEPIRSLALHRIADTAEERHVRALIDLLTEDGTAVLPNGIRWESRENVLLRCRQPQPETTEPFCYDANLGERYTVGDTVYRIVKISRTEYEHSLNIYKNGFPNALDYDRISGSLILRQRRDGDYYHPAGRHCGKSLKKMFNEQKISARDRVPILCDADGIVLVYGIGCDERVRITENTVSVLILEQEEVK